MGPDHTIRVILPPDVGEGPAEVIVLLPEGVEKKRSLVGVLDSLQGVAGRGRRKAEIDQALEEERAAWDS